MRAFEVSVLAGGAVISLFAGVAIARWGLAPLDAVYAQPKTAPAAPVAGDPVTPDIPGPPADSVRPYDASFPGGSSNAPEPVVVRVRNKPRAPGPEAGDPTFEPADSLESQAAGDDRSTGRRGYAYGGPPRTPRPDDADFRREWEDDRADDRQPPDFAGRGDGAGGPADAGPPGR